ncbi:MAG: hypothetical protein Hyperionvirus7_81 [Hyperionvirus sp.]|uniref:Uncharacterized protein n=1 Tax=Hyperionvirus sp. TaxID=2487770 RepID=A0A3G5A891_9VIRU|nr:MAG: hypothetical protein Hyperionvirus7_81 [Hyperionvirus sp.]
MTGIDASFFIFDTIITMALFCARANWNKFKPSTKWTRIIGCLYSFGLLLYMYLPYTSFIHFESSTTDDFFTRIKSLQNLFQMMTPCLLTINGTIECAKELYKIFPTVFEFNLIRKILMLVYIPLYVIIIGIVSQVCYNFATQYTGFLISFMIIYTIFLLSRNIYGVLVNVIFLFICEKLFGIQLLVLYLFALIKYFTIKLVIKDYLLHLILNKPGTFARPLNDELDVSTEIIADIKREYIEGYPLDAFGLIA